jgi:hypothetical protein
MSTKVRDGRLIVVVSKNGSTEPRLQFRHGLQAPQVFGVDVNDYRRGMTIVVGTSAAGHPIQSVAGLPPGRYVVQAVLNVYETDGRWGRSAVDTLAREPRQ